MALTIADDGPEPPEETEADKEPSLGQTIMQSLARQIGGRMRTRAEWWHDDRRDLSALWLRISGGLGSGLTTRARR